MACRLLVPVPVAPAAFAESPADRRAGSAGGWSGLAGGSLGAREPGPEEDRWSRTPLVKAGSGDDHGRFVGLVGLGIGFGV